MHTGMLNVLLANDDGIYAPGLAALEKQLKTISNVTVVAPATEQSGVGHSITYLTPLTCKKVFDGERFRGWAVDGSPADCVKLGITELAERPIDLVVSGINGGLNAGINVLYSGTVAAAIEGAFFRRPSIAVSLEFDPKADFEAAAIIAVQLIPQLLASKAARDHLLNVNIPTKATQRFRAGEPIEVHCVPMGTDSHNDRYIKRQDPKGRDYYWVAGDMPPPPADKRETDVEALWHGAVTVTPLNFNLTDMACLSQMNNQQFKVSSTVHS